MKKIYLLLVIVLLSSNVSNAQCGLTDFVSFTGEYYITDITPDVLGFSTFNLGGEPTLVTLISELSDAGVVLPISYRTFSAVFIPDAGVGQDAAEFPLFFNPDCEVTFMSVDGSDITTGLQCTTGIFFGPANGGFYDITDDSEFTVVFETNINSDCGEGPKDVELFFSREVLSTDSFTIEDFNYYIARDNILHIESPNQAITNIAIANSLGQIVLNSKVDNQTKLAISLETMTRGLYIVNVVSESGTTSFKTVVR